MLCNNSFSWKLPIIFSWFKSLILRSSISFQNRINNNYLSWPTFSVTYTKNILILSNSHTIIHVKFRNFRIGLNFFSQCRIISINRINRMMMMMFTLRIWASWAGQALSDSFLYKYFKFPVSLNFWIISRCLLNGPQAL